MCPVTSLLLLSPHWHASSSRQMYPLNLSEMVPGHSFGLQKYLLAWIYFQKGSTYSVFLNFIRAPKPYFILFHRSLCHSGNLEVAHSKDRISTTIREGHQRMDGLDQNTDWFCTSLTYWQGCLMCWHFTQHRIK